LRWDGACRLHELFRPVGPWRENDLNAGKKETDAHRRTFPEKEKTAKLIAWFNMVHLPPTCIENGHNSIFNVTEQKGREGNDGKRPRMTRQKKSCQHGCGFFQGVMNLCNSRGLNRSKTKKKQQKGKRERGEEEKVYTAPRKNSDPERKKRQVEKEDAHSILSNEGGLKGTEKKGRERGGREKKNEKWAMKLTKKKNAEMVFLERKAFWVRI